LQAIESSEKNTICSFQDILPIIDKLPNLKEIPMFGADNDEEDLRENHLRDKSSSQRKAFLKKHSQVKKLTRTCKNSFKVNPV
jgi:hypothetical protein